MGQITRASQAVHPVQAIKDGDVGGLIQGLAGQLSAALPQHLRSERFNRICMTTLRTNPKLMSCTPASLLGALMETAQLGLEPGVGQMIHLIPYGREVTVIVGYQGYIELARRAGIQIHPPRVVYEGDEFDVDWGADNPITHKPRFQSDDDKDMLFVWVKATGPDGAVWHEVMSRKQIDSVRSKVRGRGGPWQDHLVEMARKTVVRRIAKYLWKSSEIARAEAVDGVAITGFSPEGFAQLVEDTTVVEQPEVVEAKPKRRRKKAKVEDEPISDEELARLKREDEVEMLTRREAGLEKARSAELKL